MERRAELRVVPPGDDEGLEAAWSLKERIRRSEGVLKQKRSYFERQYRGHAAHLALSAGGEVVGFAVVQPDGYLSLLGVAPEYRRRGLGTRLLGSVLDDHPTVTCHARADNEGALSFYDRAGFVEQRRVSGYYRDGTDALYLRLDGDENGSPPAGS